jgi:uncharacterized protein (DUF2336 family)
MGMTIHRPAATYLALPELQEALATAPSSRHSEIARRVTDLFLSQNADYSDEQVQVFGRVLGSLIDKIEARVVAELSERLGAAPRAPVLLMQALARADDIAVARPVLARSSMLSESDLIEVSETKSQAHLLAVSERSTLPAPVTDVLVRRGDTQVARSVASNAGARFSETGFDILSTRARSDEVLAEKLARRADVPPHIFGQILVQARDAVRCRLLAAAAPEMHAELGKVLDQVSGDIADEAPLTRDYGPATRRILLAYPDGRIEEPDLLRLALGRQHDDVVAALSVMSAISVRTIDQLMSDERPDPIQFLCKALGLAWPSARSVLQLGPGRGISSETLAVARQEYDKLPVSAAQRMLGFWQDRDALGSTG